MLSLLKQLQTKKVKWHKKTWSKLSTQEPMKRDIWVKVISLVKVVSFLIYIHFYSIIGIILCDFLFKNTFIYFYNFIYKHHIFSISILSLVYNPFTFSLWSLWFLIMQLLSLNIWICIYMWRHTQPNIFKTY